MPTVESRMRARIKGAPDVASLVSNQVYAGFAPTTASGDYIVLQRISTTPLNTLAGQNANGDVQARIQVDCLATPQPVTATAPYGREDTYNRVKRIADAVRATLHGWSDPVAKITSCLLDNEIDDTEPPEDGSNVTTQRVIQDYIVWFQ